MPAQVEAAQTQLAWSRGRLQRVEACPACGSTARIGRPLSCTDRRTPLRLDRWTMHRCAHCKSLYLDPRPDDESLPRAYDSYYTHEPEDEHPALSGSTGLLWRLIHGYLNHRFAMSRRPASLWGKWVFSIMFPWRMKLDYYGRHLSVENLPQRGRLLDLGCGNGAFVARANEMGWQACGLDPDPKAVEACCRQGLNVIQGNLSSASSQWFEYFDVITMSHCIEHVADPSYDLKLAFSLLRPAGVLWLALPNPLALGARFFGGSWRGLHAPYHLCIPSQARLAELLAEAGFTEIRRLRRGIHARVLTQESAENARHSGEPKMQWRALLAPVIRVLADAAGSLSPRGGEETVIRARRPAQP